MRRAVFQKLAVLRHQLCHLQPRRSACHVYGLLQIAQCAGFRGICQNHHQQPAVLQPGRSGVPASFAAAGGRPERLPERIQPTDCQPHHAVQPRLPHRALHHHHGGAPQHRRSPPVFCPCRHRSGHAFCTAILAGHAAGRGRPAGAFAGFLQIRSACRRPLRLFQNHAARPPFQGLVLPPNGGNQAGFSQAGRPVCADAVFAGLRQFHRR